jgi:RimJ/RimL family protein N-acetyltransferase
VIEKTMKKARELGYKEVILNVHEENSRAIDLFERCGFKVVQKNPGTREIKMKKEL